MASAFRKSMRVVFRLLKRDRLNQELQHRLAQHDKDFLKKIIDPAHADGLYHRQYNAEVAQIRAWYSQQQHG